MQKPGNVHVNSAFVLLSYLLKVDGDFLIVALKVISVTV